MAFDLNKNDGADQVTSNTTQSSSKFDLSKGDVETPVIPDPAPSSKKWILVFVALLIVGGGIWFYSSKDENPKIESSPATEVVTNDSATTTTSDTAGTVQPALESKDTTTQTAATIAQQPAEETPNDEVARLNNKPVASFAQGSATIGRIDQSLLQKIVSYLNQNPAASIDINGYASSDGSLSVNQTVSQARADSFKELLISKQVAENRIAAVGKGIENPIASNATNAGRKRNRRIEIAFK